MSTTNDRFVVASWAEIAAQAAEDKNGERVVILEVGQVSSITDYFVIVSASNDRLVRAIADTVEKVVKAEGGPSPLHVEGKDDASWVLVDFGSFVVHIFLNETRDYYDLERLWGDVPRMEWERPLATARA